MFTATISRGAPAREQALHLAKRLERILAADASVPEAHPRMRLAKALAQTLIEEITLAEIDGAA